MTRVNYAKARARAQPQLSAQPLLETTLPGGEPWAVFYRRNFGYLVRFVDLVDFEISPGGTEITVRAVPGVSTETVDHLYKNQASPLALSLQKKLVLHGSAVEISDGAIAFIGETGRGKSTLAASFSSNGFRFLTDDGLRIDKTEKQYIVQPSHPSLRLWNDSREATAHAGSLTAPATAYSSKLRFLADEHFLFCAESRALQRIYFLGDGASNSISIAAVSGQAAFIEMRRHCFLLGLDQPELLAHNFQQLAELSRLPIFFSLDYPRRYDILEQVREAIVNHLNTSLQ